MADFDDRSGIVDCKTPWGRWWQTVDDVTAEVQLTECCKAKDITCSIKPRLLSVSVKGNVVLQGELQKTIQPDESIWTLEDNRLIRICLTKCDKTAASCWTSLLADQYEADAFTLDRMQQKLTLQRYQLENPGMDFTNASISGNYQGVTDREIELLEGARTNDVQRVRTSLANKKLNINTKNNMERTALHLAAANGHTDVLFLLANARADCNFPDKYGMTPIMWAAMGGHIKAMQLLIDAKADTKEKNKQRLNIVHCVALINQVKSMKFIAGLKDKPDVNDVCVGDHTALHLAAERGHDKIVDILLDMDADVTSKNKIGQTAVHLAAANGHSVVIELMESFIDDINDQDQYGTTALMLAAANGHLEVVRKLIDFQLINVNIADEKGMTALMMASSNGHEEIVSLLLRNKRLQCDPSLQNLKKETALHLAAYHGHVTVAKWLVCGMCNVNKTNKLKQTALHVAAELGNADMVGVLLQAPGIHLTARDSTGKTALAMASRAEWITVVDLIIKHERLAVLLPAANNNNKNDASATQQQQSPEEDQQQQQSDDVERTSSQASKRKPRRRVGWGDMPADTDESQSSPTDEMAADRVPSLESNSIGDRRMSEESNDEKIEDKTSLPGGDENPSVAVDDVVATFSDSDSLANSLLEQGYVANGSIVDDSLSFADDRNSLVDSLQLYPNVRVREISDEQQTITSNDDDTIGQRSEADGENDVTSILTFGTGNGLEPGHNGSEMFDRPPTVGAADDVDSNAVAYLANASETASLRSMTATPLPGGSHTLDTGSVGAASQNPDVERISVVPEVTVASAQSTPATKNRVVRVSAVSKVSVASAECAPETKSGSKSSPETGKRSKTKKSTWDRFANVEDPLSFEHLLMVVNSFATADDEDDDDSTTGSTGGGEVFPVVEISVKSGVCKVVETGANEDQPMQLVPVEVHQSDVDEADEVEQPKESDDVDYGSNMPPDDASYVSGEQENRENDEPDENNWYPNDDHYGDIWQDSRTPSPSSSQQHFSSASSNDAREKQARREKKRQADAVAEMERAMEAVLWKLAHKQLKKDDWKLLARYWKFTSDQTLAIQHQFTGSNSYKMHGYRLLKIWFQCHCVLATKLHTDGDSPFAVSAIGQLYSALCAIGRRRLAEQVRNSCNKKAANELKGSSKSCIIS